MQCDQFCIQNILHWSKDSESEWIGITIVEKFHRLDHVFTDDFPYSYVLYQIPFDKVAKTGRKKWNSSWNHNNYLLLK